LSAPYTNLRAVLASTGNTMANSALMTKERPYSYLTHLAVLPIKYECRNTFEDIIMKKLVLCLAISLMLHSFAPAKELKTDHMNAHDMLKTRLDAVLGILAKSDLTYEEKDKRVLKTVTPIFDFPLMAKLTLGRTQWESLSKKEREEFTLLFIKHLKNSYRDKITLYTDQKIIFKPVVVKKTRAIVPTELASKDSTLAILYKLRKQEKQPWKVYDVEIQGVSLIITYQSQFKEVLQRGTINDLLEQLKDTGDKDAAQQEPGHTTH
jgi:phospholipid transport system substrate-binding protein